jgi:Ni,Fe-hydrogenase I cytochrome b subunit
MAIRADVMGRQSSVSTIMSGWRFYKDDYPGDDPR